MSLKLIFHLVAAVHFFYGCYYDFVYVKFPVTKTSPTPFGGKFKYLTYLDAVRYMTTLFVIMRAMTLCKVEN